MIGTTTKEIKKQRDDLISDTFVYNSKEERENKIMKCRKFDDVVWCRLDELQKEMDIIEQQSILLNSGIEDEFSQADAWQKIKKKILCLCKSQERSKGLSNAEHSSTESVFCEQNTGEESTISSKKVNVPYSSPVHSPSCGTQMEAGEDKVLGCLNNSISESSPVQNPNERYSDSFSRVKASGQESLKNSPANIPKKCTCPRPMPLRHF